MSSNQPTLFGAYPWADGSTSAPTLFGSGYIPQTYSVPLDETITDTEAELFSTTKVLSDTVPLTEAQVMAITKILADSETVTEAVAKTVQKIFAETGTVTESAVIFTIKDFQDFLVLKEWISIRLNKQITWVNPSTNANVFDTLYGEHVWGGRNVLWGGLKPLASWSRGSTSRRPSVFTNDNGHKYNE